MHWSKFGEKFAAESGIVQLMADLGEALAENPDILFLGGGNPARIPGAEAVFERCLRQVLDDEQERHKLFGIYQAPQGDSSFRRDVAALLRREFGWGVSERNIAITNGSQSAFFLIHNMLAGHMPDGSHRSIHLPLVPEYIGYADAGLSEPFFTSTAPSIELLDDRQFKYRVDLTGVAVPEQTAALCVSRPTNPTGNVLTDDEVDELDAVARQWDIPLIIDGAYGLPFPGMTYVEAAPRWNDNTILVLSLSKLGLPGARTGIVVAAEEMIDALANAGTILSLACGNLGPAVAHQLFRSGEVLSLSRNIVAPFYREKSQAAMEAFTRELPTDVPWRLHKPEGGMFLWLWLEGLPGGTLRLYQRLKRREVLVVPGEHFFIACEPGWQHQHECLRISYAQPQHVVEQGAAIIAQEIALAYAQSSE